MTVKELRKYLEEQKDDMPVFVAAFKEKTCEVSDIDAICLNGECVQLNIKIVCCDED